MCVGWFLLRRGSFSICTADGMSSSTMPPLYTFYTFYHLCQHGRRFQVSMHEYQVSMGSTGAPVQEGIGERLDKDRWSLLGP